MNSITCKRLFFTLSLLFCLSLRAEEGPKSLPAETWPQLKTLTGIKVVKNPADLVQLIVLFDPNCPYCAKLWSHLYGKEARHHQVASLWVPVTYMSKDSAGKAARLLSANSRQALASNFENFDFSRRSGAAGVADVSSSMRLSLERNTSTWQKIMPATPLLIYKAKDGQVFSQIGLPPEAILNELLNQLSASTLQNFSQ